MHNRRRGGVWMLLRLLFSLMICYVAVDMQVRENRAMRSPSTASTSVSHLEMSALFLLLDNFSRSFCNGDDRRVYVCAKRKRNDGSINDTDVV
jgi:hypothetical protein